MEAVLLSFGENYPKVFLDNACDETIIEFVRSSGYQPYPGEICVCLPEDKTAELVSRILRLGGIFSPRIDRIGDFEIRTWITLSQHQTIHDPLFAKQIVHKMKQRTPCRSDIEYVGHCLRVACKFNARYFVQELLCSLPIEDGRSNSMEFSNIQEDGYFYRWTNPNLLPKTKPLKSHSTLYLLQGDIELGLANALQYGYVDILDIIFMVAKYNFNTSFGRLEMTTILQSEMQGMTPVIYAAYTRCKSSVEYLLSQKVKLRKTDSNNCNALHYCVAAGWVDVVERLITRQKKLVKQENKIKETPLKLVLHLGKVDIYDKLVQMDIYTESNDIYSKRGLQCIFDGIKYCHEMCDDHFTAFGCPLPVRYLKENSLSNESDFLSILKRLPEKQMSSYISEIDLDTFENKLPHYCVMNRLWKIFLFIRDAFPNTLQVRNKSKLPTCLHLAVFTGRSDITASILEMDNNGMEATDLKLPDVLRLGREFSNTLPQNIMMTDYLFLRKWIDNQYLKRETGTVYGIQVRFGHEKEYDEIETLLQL